MTEPWPIYCLVFVLVFLGAQQLQAGLSGLARSDRQTRRRLGTLAPAEARQGHDVLRRRASRFGASAPVLALSRLILQSGTSLSPAALAAIWLALSLVGFLVLPAIPSLPLRLAAGLAGGGLCLVVWLRRRRARRIARFGEQLPEVIDIIVRSLRAGHPLAVSLNLVAREIPKPAGPEFALVVDEVSYGRSITEALENLYRRVGYPELKYFVASASIAHQTGGNLGEILSRLSRMLRDRFRLTRRVRALSAEGRFSGIALSVLPVALFVLINLVSPAYYADFWQSAAAGKVLMVSLGLLLVGNVIIFRLVNLKV